MDITKTKAYIYALECSTDTSGRTPCYVKKQAQKWLAIADGKCSYAKIGLNRYKYIRSFLKMMVHPDLHIDMYSALEPYAHFLIFAIYCTMRTDGGRLYDTAILEIARKNYKTFNSGVIFIIGMLTEPHFSRFFSVAPDYKLSSELRLAVRKIIKSSPNLVKHFKITNQMITCKLSEIEYTPLAYSNDKMDGKLANIFLADEAGALDTYPIEAMRSSQITLKNKLGIIISTQYPNDNNAMIDEVDIAKKSLDGLLDDNSIFALLYEPDEEIKLNWQKNDNVIYQANPVACHNDIVFSAIKKLRGLAILYENKRENFLCKHCNIKYQGLGVEGFVGIDEFKLCMIPFDADFWRGKRVYIGLDLSQTEDNTAVAMVTLWEGKIYAAVWGFIPGGKIERKSTKEHVDYKALIRAGVCFATGSPEDEVVDYNEIESFIMDLPEKYGVDIIQLGYDRYNAISSVNKFENAGIECVEIKQHSSVTHVPTKLLFEYILKRDFCYMQNRMLEINMQNARCTKDTNLNRYINKKKSAGKVDMVVSLINAVYLLNVNEIMEQDASFSVIV